MWGPTKDGSIAHRLHDIHYRPIRPDDWHRLQLFHRRLSMDTVVLRFHAAKRELSTPLSHRLTDLDPANDVALVATTGTRGRIIGVARYCRINATCAEVAFVVEDAYQHHGVGRQLMRRLRNIALQNGITELVGEVLPGNVAALRLLKDAGATRSVWHASAIEVHVDLSTPFLSNGYSDDAAAC
jgi:GNAT superfamily N-acetyltransferase